MTAPAQDLGRHLRDWRHRRRMSQLDLACDAGIPAKYLSLLETGRKQPARQMLLHLATCLQVPLRDRNVLLIAAGFAPTIRKRAFNAPELETVRRNIEAILSAQDPNPALVVDQH